MSLLRLEPLVMLAALVVYAAATAALFVGVWMDKPGVQRAGYALAASALAVQSVSMAMRWVAVGHGPYLTRYEVLASNAWVSVALFLVVYRLRPSLRALSTVILPAAFLLLGLGLYTGPQVLMLPPTFGGTWLVLHIAFYFAAFAAGLVSVAASLTYIFRGSAFGKRVLGTRDPAALDADAYRFAGLTFAFWGVGMLAGSIWAHYSWGSFWTWDPVETWSLITWGVYGLYLHLRRFYGMKGTPAALVLLVGFALAVGSLFFTSLLTNSLHAAYFR